MPVLTETRTAAPSEPRTFSQLTTELHRRLKFQSSLDALRGALEYAEIVAMGEKAVPRILSTLAFQQDGYPSDLLAFEDRSYLVLALEDIAGRNITGGAKSIEDRVEKALQWGEQESRIGIRSATEKHRIAKELIDSSKRMIAHNVQVQGALAEQLLFGEGLDRTRNRDGKTLVIPTNGRDVIVAYDSEVGMTYRSAAIEISPRPHAEDQRENPPSLSARFMEIGLRGSRGGSFAVEGVVSDSYEAARKFNEALEILFSNQGV